MGGRGFFCAVVGCTSAVWVVCRQSPEEWGRGGETAAATIAATALCRAADRQSQRLRSRGGKTGCSRGRDARNDISDRGPSLHVLRTTRAGRLRPRALHGRGGRAEPPSRAGAVGWKAGAPESCGHRAQKGRTLESCMAAGARWKSVVVRMQSCRAAGRRKGWIPPGRYLRS